MVEFFNSIVCFKAVVPVRTNFVTFILKALIRLVQTQVPSPVFFIVMVVRTHLVTMVSDITHTWKSFEYK